MLYLMSQIFAWLAVTTLLGVGIGWWMRASRSSRERGTSVAELERSRREVEELEDKLRAIAGAATERANEATELDELRLRVAGAEAQAEDATRESEEAHRRIAELEQTALAYKVRIGVLTEEAAALSPDKLSGALADERRAHARTRQDLESLQSVHADCDFAFETLRQQIVMLRKEVRALKAQQVRPLARPKVQRSVVPVRPAAGAPPRRPATLLSSPAGAPDDLKRINGIGPQLEGILNQLGVYHYKQVASLSVDEARWLDSQLADFQGRIERDGWIEQARGLVEGRRASGE